ncbi:MAG: radical SAM family heme chaperone HemW [Clostridia bacterium]|nr:radical SAM family heme chaperone HemW [Clostridia bacterium]
MISLYFHIPYCIRKCRYCDFCSVPVNETIDGYADALIRELALKKEQYPDETTRTVFFGGGTPTTLRADDLCRVLELANRLFPLAEDAEISIECNPKTASLQSLKTLHGGGFNRISIGLQSTDDSLLRRICRVHSCDDFLQTFEWARTAGFANINVDLMHGLPGQTTEQYLGSLQQVFELQPEHISAYSLILEEGTPLAEDVARGKETLPDPDTVADMQDAGMDALEHAGYLRYEISNFARPGYSCRHNLTYWNNEPYLGFGVAAHSSMGNGTKWYRFSNTDSIPQYLRKIAAGRVPEAERILINTFERMFETVMLGLRKTEGVSYASFSRMFGCDLKNVFAEAIERNRVRALWEPDPERLRLNRRGLDLLNMVLLDFQERNYWDLLKAD